MHRLSVYVGRLAGDRTPDDDAWSHQIALIEQLLIYVHTPAYNAAYVASELPEELRTVRIFNWGQFRDVMPELSGKRWLSDMPRAAYGTQQQP